MGARKRKEYDLGSNGTITFHVSEDTKRLLIDFDVDEKRLTKTAINLLIDALRETRKTMVRKARVFTVRVAGSVRSTDQHCKVSSLPYSATE